MSLQELISNYGYAAIAVGTFFEGETILILGGFAAHRGYLELPWVVVSAFLGTLCGDQLYFYIGRSKGVSAFAERPGWKQKSDKVFRLMNRHQTWLILGFRFIYGIRTVTPFLIGASRVSPLRFLVLNTIGGLVWAVVVGTLGYLFGQTLELIVADLKKYELFAFAGLAGIGLLVWTFYQWRKLASTRKYRSDSGPGPK
ncbi:MAG TPA: DedA family protein [Gammaproteobacteria bacterium]|nr:DedA family protein [Gammaproteobacteria bacterium]